MILTILVYRYSFANDYELSSPGGNNVVKIQCDKTVRFTVLNKNAAILSVDELALQLENIQWGDVPKIEKAKRMSSKTTINVPVPTKFSTIIDHYNQLEIVFKSGYSIIFRAYDNGVAYRFVTRLSQPVVTVKNEGLSFNVQDARNTIWPYEYSKHSKPMQSHFEYLFKNMKYDIFF